MFRIPTGDPLTGAPRKLVWNAWDQLVEVRVESSNALLQTNAYDGLFRRTTRTLADSTVIHQYYNDQWKPIEERKDAATTALNVYYWGARPGHRDELIRRDRDTDGNGTLDETLWCLMDYFDPMAILDSGGAVQERYTYSAFGVPLILAPDYATRGSSSFAWDFLFHGQFTDAETGYQNYGFRFYVPALGTWPSRDPFFPIPNPYHFSKNSQPNFVDFLGLLTIAEVILFASLAAIVIIAAIATYHEYIRIYRLEDVDCDCTDLCLQRERTKTAIRVGWSLLMDGQYSDFDSMRDALEKLGINTVGRLNEGVSSLGKEFLNPGERNIVDAMEKNRSDLNRNPDAKTHPGLTTGMVKNKGWADQWLEAEIQRLEIYKDLLENEISRLGCKC
ncbi:MAG: hypothetical protein JNK37_21225 [Verrucomicrobiales bacterium]|nr:hypothetical protein [Verrucomicrobiales bacterium]